MNSNRVAAHPGVQPIVRIDIEVVMSPGQPQRDSIGSCYDIVLDGREFAEGAAQTMWIHLANGRPTPLPDAIRVQLPNKNSV